MKGLPFCRVPVYLIVPLHIAFEHYNLEECEGNANLGALLASHA